MARTNFETLKVYRLAEQLADAVWDVAAEWKPFAQDTVGKQIVRAADSVGANIAEGTGRGSFKDNARLVRVARGSLYETRHWLRRAYTRRLLTTAQVNKIKPIIDNLSPMLNAYLKSIGKKHAKKNPVPAGSR
jgi:four helix bundle protein